jgi:hypothetical protein
VLIQNAASFHAEGRFQRACANCGATGSFHVHHVVDKQTLRRIFGCGKKDPRLYDTRNALRLCDSLDGNRCHMNMEWGNGRVRVSTWKLTSDNIAYAFETLKDWAGDYLRAQYDDSTPDPRILQLESRDKEPA